jgi:predicted lysophospholipase L1 biosynthesis ABC-type transport system permease subunit
MTHLWVEYESEFLKEKGVFAAGREVEKSIARALGLDPMNPSNASTVRLHARDEIADGTLAHGSDVIGQAARVPFVFLAILAIGFIAMLVADADASKREFAVLRAVGATRGQLTFRLARGALRTALWGIVCGLPVGALVGWLFSLSTGAMWPGLPHYFVVPWRVLAEGTAGALAFVLLVAVPTSLVLVARAVRGGMGR